MRIQDVFANLTQKMAESPAGLGKLNAVYQFDLSGEQAGTYQLKISEGKVEWAQAAPDEATCTLQLSDENFLKLVQGKLNPTMAFMSGKLKIKGDMTQALKLQSVLENYS
ncbi:MAG: SCP2 sterol-binding domain-containing protein [Bacillota bacterium]|nr:SCP2 sterol-binding domain-containing protein [Bacillota bacterium]MDW7684856.1 SCP2 sterol-binding domain-containing protein [Bacillota bacterium]